MGYKILSQGVSDWADLSGKPDALSVDIDDAVTKKHTQNTDQYLDYGGENQASAIDVKDAVTKKHQHTNQVALDLISGTNTGDQDLSGYEMRKSQIISVATNGGDYTTITAALGAITDAAVSKRYVILVYPGNYVESITMKPYVDIIGFGRTVCTITSSGVTVVSANNSRIAGFDITTSSNAWNGFVINLVNTTNTFIIEDCNIYKTSSNQICICIGNTGGTTSPLTIRRSRVSAAINSASSDGGQALYRIGDFLAEDCSFYCSGADSTMDVVQLRAGTQYLKNCYIEFTSGTLTDARCVYKDTSGTCYLLNVILFNNTSNGFEIYGGAGTTVIITGGGKVSARGDTGTGTITYT